LILLLIALRICVMGVVYVQSESMQPNIHKADGIIVNHLAYGINVPFSDSLIYQWRLPHRGEIVTFRNPHDDGMLWMKRVIGLPGDTLEFREHILYLDGINIQQSNKNIEMIPTQQAGTQNNILNYKIWHSYLEDDWGPVTITEDHLFLMGDNRGNSLDSRSWGMLHSRYLQGEASLRFWPLERLGWIQKKP